MIVSAHTQSNYESVSGSVWRDRHESEEILIRLSILMPLV